MAPASGALRTSAVRRPAIELRNEANSPPNTHKVKALAPIRAKPSARADPARAPGREWYAGWPQRSARAPGSEVRNEAIFPPNPHKRKPLASSGAKPPIRAADGWYARVGWWFVRQDRPPILRYHWSSGILRKMGAQMVEAAGKINRNRRSLLKVSSVSRRKDLRAGDELAGRGDSTPAAISPVVVPERPSRERRSRAGRRALSGSVGVHSRGECHTTGQRTVVRGPLHDAKCRACFAVGSLLDAHVPAWRATQVDPMAALRDE